MTAEMTFNTKIRVEPGGRMVITLPFDPGEVWGQRSRYHVTGTIDGRPVRGALSSRDGGAALALGPASGHNRWLKDGDRVEVSLRPEGPQADGLAPDIALALDANPEARRVFESLATFYRKGWLSWIDATKRRPEVRAERIAQMVQLLCHGHKQRPREAQQAHRP
jgi:hypothetical protein